MRRRLIRSAGITGLIGLLAACNAASPGASTGPSSTAPRATARRHASPSVGGRDQPGPAGRPRHRRSEDAHPVRRADGHRATDGHLRIRARRRRRPVERRHPRAQRVHPRLRLRPRRSRETASPRRSDARPKDQVADLRALLAVAKVTPPYILVGYSLGGWNVMVHADAHPADVVGAVMVDVRPPAASQAVAQGASARSRRPNPRRSRRPARRARPSTPTRRSTRKASDSATAPRRPSRRRASVTSRSSCSPPRTRPWSPRASSPPSPRNSSRSGGTSRASSRRARPRVAWSRSRTRPTRCRSSGRTSSPTRSRRSSATEAAATPRPEPVRTGSPGRLSPGTLGPARRRGRVARGGRLSEEDAPASTGARQDHPRRGRERRPPGPCP